MLKISTKGQYALLIMESLAEEQPDNYVPLKLLSHRHNLSIKYLEQILIQLSKAGLVTGLRGYNGGYKLNRPANQYTVGEILRVMEGDLSPKGINDGNALSNIGYDSFWTEFGNVINNFVNSVTLESIVEKNRESAGFLYYI